jgi:hypothetical protein
LKVRITSRGWGGSPKLALANVVPLILINEKPMFIGVRRNGEAMTCQFDRSSSGSLTETAYHRSNVDFLILITKCKAGLSIEVKSCLVPGIDETDDRVLSVK